MASWVTTKVTRLSTWLPVETADRPEAAHHQQVYRAVSGLQHQCAQNGQHEQSQLFQDAALREIGLIIFQGNPSFRP